jgi:hypothetical protein
MGPAAIPAPKPLSLLRFSPVYSIHKYGHGAARLCGNLPSLKPPVRKNNSWETPNPGSIISL